MSKRNRTFASLVVIATAMFAFTLSNSADAQLVSELGILDLNANGGLNPATGAAWADGDQYRLAFVSSTFTSPEFQDVSIYNTHVQTAANSAGLGSANWNAIASTWNGDGGATVDARDNTGTNFTVTPVGGSVFLIDGSTIIANNNTDLWDGSINAPINRTESNGAYAPPLSSPFGQFGGAWAGTTDSGTNRGVAALGGPRADLGLTIATNSQWVRRADINPHNNAPLGLYALSEALTVTDMSGGGGPPTPVSLLSTDFTGRTVTGSIASTIPWVTDGIADPGDLTAVGGPGLFDTANAQGHFAPDRNVDNEGPWSVDIPINLTTAEVVIDEIVIDWQHFNNAGAFQTANRSVDWTATLTGSTSGLIAMEELLDINGIAGMDTFDFGGVTLTDDESWILQIMADGNSGGNNTGLNAINVTGFINAAAVPEPASVAIWSLIGLGLAGIGVYRARRKK